MQDLDQLKDLLLGRECRQMEGLSARLSDPLQRARDLAEVLPEALRMRAGDGDDLVSALQEPVARCVRAAIEHDAKSYAEALVPFMEPAIRRAAGGTFGSLFRSGGQGLGQGLSRPRWRWRWEAWRTGVPLAAVALRHQLVYRVEAAYLFQNGSGLLMGRAVAATHNTLRNGDDASAALAAVASFVRETFAGSSEGDFEVVEIGGRYLWVIKGAEASLACLIRGIPPLELRDLLGSVLAQIHTVYGPQLAAFRGDQSALVRILDLLERCLALQYRDTTQGARRAAIWPRRLFLLLGLVTLGYLAWPWIEREGRLERVAQRLRSEPGLVLLDRRREWDGATFTLLRDPLAPDPAGLVADAGGSDRIGFVVTPFESLEPSLVLERARRLLHPPSGVDLRLEGATLHAVGKAPPDWIARLRNAAVLPPGVEVLDLGGLGTSAE